jgi:hypothetical protein
MLDNFDLIRSLLSFDKDEDRYYHLQVIIRGKDNPDMSGANRMVKAYYVTSLEQFDWLKEEVIKMCTLFNARAYINISPKSARETTLLQLKEIADRIQFGDYRKVWRLWNTCAGNVKGKPQAWVVDLDDCSKVDNGVLSFIAQLEPIGGDKIVATIPTKSGYHLITRPFRLDKFRERYPDVDVHKNNPTVLYIP